MRSLLCLVLLCAVAVAAPNSRLLVRGRMFESAGKHAEAVAAYEEYLEAAPDDVVANAELGFAALQAKDLVKAEAATRRAIDKAAKPHYPHDPQGKALGAALYNLGLIEEAQGKPKDAAESYKASLVARSSRVVREQLQKLDPSLAAAADPLATARLAGPFKDIKALCQARLQANNEQVDSTWGDGHSCDKLAPIKLTAGKLAKPLEAVQAFQFDAREDLELAIKLRDGWYHFSYAGGPDRGQGYCGGTDFTVQVLPVGTAPPQLTFEYTSKNTGCDHAGNGGGRAWGWDETGLIAIGIGPSGKPSAPHVLPTSVYEWTQGDDGPRLETKTTLKYVWSKTGALDVTGTFKPGSGIGDLGAFDADDVLGHHLVVFP